MTQVSYTLQMKGGVVTMLFTPRLYAFKGTEGVTFEHEKNDAISMQSLYADIMYCAALNHWTLTHSGEQEFPFKRVDFHEYSGTNRESFWRVVLFACEALSGKSVSELIEDANKRKEIGNNEAQEKNAGIVKKKSLFGSIIQRLRHS